MTKGFISAQAVQLRDVKLFLSSQAAAFLGQHVCYRNCLFYQLVLAHTYACCQLVCPCTKECDLFGFFRSKTISLLSKISEICLIFYHDFDSKILFLAAVNIGAPRQKPG